MVVDIVGNARPVKNLCRTAKPLLVTAVKRKKYIGLKAVRIALIQILAALYKLNLSAYSSSSTFGVLPF